MEEIGKRMWKVVRGVLSMVRRGIISKRKLMMELKYLILRRGKKNLLIFHHAVADDHDDDGAILDAVSPNSPYLPGFGRTPLAVRPLRITDSPFPLNDDDDNCDAGFVDRAAEDFIQRFYKDLIQQKRTLYHSSLHI